MPGLPCADPLPCDAHPLGLTVTNAKGGESGHNYGCATDWTLWTPDAQTIWMKGSDPRWQVYLDAIKKVGLRSGSTFPNPDYPHNEILISCSFKQVAQIYSAQGMTADGPAGSPCARIACRNAVVRSIPGEVSAGPARCTICRCPSAAR